MAYREVAEDATFDHEPKMSNAELKEEKARDRFHKWLAFLFMSAVAPAFLWLTIGLGWASWMSLFRCVMSGLSLFVILNLLVILVSNRKPWNIQ